MSDFVELEAAHPEACNDEYENLPSSQDEEFITDHEPEGACYAQYTPLDEQELYDLKQIQERFAAMDEGDLGYTIPRQSQPSQENPEGEVSQEQPGVGVEDRKTGIVVVIIFL